MGKILGIYGCIGSIGTVMWVLLIRPVSRVMIRTLRLHGAEDLLGLGRKGVIFVDGWMRLLVEGPLVVPGLL